MFTERYSTGNNWQEGFTIKAYDASGVLLNTYTPDMGNSVSAIVVPVEAATVEITALHRYQGGQSKDGTPLNARTPSVAYKSGDPLGSSVSEIAWKDKSRDAKQSIWLLAANTTRDQIRTTSFSDLLTEMSKENEGKDPASADYRTFVAGNGALTLKHTLKDGVNYFAARAYEEIYQVVRNFQGDVITTYDDKTVGITLVRPEYDFPKAEDIEFGLTYANGIALEELATLEGAGQSKTSNQAFLEALLASPCTNPRYAWEVVTEGNFIELTEAEGSKDQKKMQITVNPDAAITKKTEVTIKCTVFARYPEGKANAGQDIDPSRAVSQTKTITVWPLMEKIEINGMEKESQEETITLRYVNDTKRETRKLEALIWTDSTATGEVEKAEVTNSFIQWVVSEEGPQHPVDPLEDTQGTVITVKGGLVVPVGIGRATITATNPWSGVSSEPIQVEVLPGAETLEITEAKWMSGDRGGTKEKEGGQDRIYDISDGVIYPKINGTVDVTSGPEEEAPANTDASVSAEEPLEKTTIQLSYEVNGSGGSGSGSYDLTWSSSNETVATVDEDGLVTIDDKDESGGVAEITIQENETGTKASLFLVVNGSTILGIDAKYHVQFKINGGTYTLLGPNDTEDDMPNITHTYNYEAYHGWGVPSSGKAEEADGLYGWISGWKLNSGSTARFQVVPDRVHIQEPEKEGDNYYETLNKPIKKVIFEVSKDGNYEIATKFGEPSAVRDSFKVNFKLKLAGSSAGEEEPKLRTAKSGNTANDSPELEIANYYFGTREETYVLATARIYIAGTGETVTGDDGYAQTFSQTSSGEHIKFWWTKGNKETGGYWIALIPKTMMEEFPLLGNIDFIFKENSGGEIAYKLNYDGDLNGDNKLNVQDALLLESIRNGKGESLGLVDTTFLEADLNVDGRVDGTDLDLLWTMIGKHEAGTGNLGVGDDRPLFEGMEPEKNAVVFYTKVTYPNQEEKVGYANAGEVVTVELYAKSNVPDHEALQADIVFVKDNFSVVEGGVTQKAALGNTAIGESGTFVRYYTKDKTTIDPEGTLLMTVQLKAKTFTSSKNGVMEQPMATGNTVATTKRTGSADTPGELGASHTVRRTIKVYDVRVQFSNGGVDNLVLKESDGTDVGSVTYYAKYGKQGLYTDEARTILAKAAPETAVKEAEKDHYEIVDEGEDGTGAWLNGGEAVWANRIISHTPYKESQTYTIHYFKTWVVTFGVATEDLADDGILVGERSYIYRDGAVITVVPEPKANENYAFTMWEFGGGAARPLGMEVTEDLTFTAYFESSQRTVIWYDVNGNELHKEEELVNGALIPWEDYAGEYPVGEFKGWFMLPMDKDENVENSLYSGKGLYKEENFTNARVTRNVAFRAVVSGHVGLGVDMSWGVKSGNVIYTPELAKNASNILNIEYTYTGGTPLTITVPIRTGFKKPTVTYQFGNQTPVAVPEEPQSVADTASNTYTYTVPLQLNTESFDVKINIATDIDATFEVYDYGDVYSGHSLVLMTGGILDEDGQPLETSTDFPAGHYVYEVGDATFYWAEEMGNAGTGKGYSGYIALVKNSDIKDSDGKQVLGSKIEVRGTGEQQPKITYKGNIEDLTAAKPTDADAKFLQKLLNGGPGRERQYLEADMDKTKNLSILDAWWVYRKVKTPGT